MIERRKRKERNTNRMKKQIVSFWMALIMVCTILHPVQAASTKLKATITKSTTKKTTSGVKLTVKVTSKNKISYIKYMVGNYSKKKVMKSGKKLKYNAKTKKASVTVKSNNTYSFVIKDKKGKSILKKVSVTNYSNPKYADQYKAVWFAYYDYQKYLKSYSKNNETNFRSYFKKVLTNCKSKNLNTIIVHVRPCSDAMYSSAYFPTSEYIAKKQGKTLSYDPLAVMVEEAHKQGVAIEAWINPYRVSFKTDYSKLSKDNPARIWHQSEETKRNVLSYGGKLYYNPSKEEVRTLIIDGVKEIVQNYDVDGVHMDDYFYPSFSSKNYKTAFDAKEYNASPEKKNGDSIVTYRRKQVDLLVKGIKSAVEETNPNVSFGISPAGNIDNLKSKYKYYVDIEKWTNSTEYVDYIAPQIYWGFHHSVAPFDKVTNRWEKITDQNKVKLYIGLPAYRVGTSSANNKAEYSELHSSNILRKMIQYGRKKSADGFIVFDYEDLNRSKAKSAVNQMGLELK